MTCIGGNGAQFLEERASKLRSRRQRKELGRRAFGACVPLLDTGWQKDE